MASGGWTALYLHWVAPIAGMIAGMHSHEALRSTSPAAVEAEVPRKVAPGVEGPLNDASGSRPERAAPADAP